MLESTTTIVVKNLADLITDPTEYSLIDLSESIFYNLNFGKMIYAISLLDGATKPITDLTNMDYPTFDNHGSVLNL